MLIIRLRRTGKKNKPSYRVVAAEHSFAVNGKFAADLGSYNPHTRLATLKLDEIKTWLDKGAKPSNTVAKIFEREKIKHRLVVVVKKNKKPKTQAEKAVKAPSATPAEVVEATETDVATEASTPDVESTAEDVAAAPEEPTETPAEDAPAA